MEYHQVATSHPISPSSHVNVRENLEIGEAFWGMQVHEDKCHPSLKPNWEGSNSYQKEIGILFSD